MLTSENNLPFLRRFLMYQKERFPLLANGIFLTAFAFSAISYSRICRGETGFVDWKLFVAAAVTTLSFFFLLRIADEFKDREIDAEHRPYLPVPRGLISFQELKWLGWAAFAVQILVNLFLTPQMFSWLLVPQVFLVLMMFNFFAPDWLNRHWVAYVLSHMFFFPAIDMYSSAMDWYLEGPGQAPFGMAFFFAVSYINGLVWEVGRKIRTPENEEFNSYTKMYGMRKAVWIWMGIITLAFAMAVAAATYANLGWLGAGVLLVIYGSSLVYGILFLRKPTVKLSKLIELASGGWGLLMYLTLGALPMILRWVGY
jgi:4-hydroxybenzoate polyprenyltransferase